MPDTDVFDSFSNIYLIKHAFSDTTLTEQNFIAFYLPPSSLLESSFLFFFRDTLHCFKTYQDAWGEKSGSSLNSGFFFVFFFGFVQVVIL